MFPMKLLPGKHRQRAKEMTPNRALFRWWHAEETDAWPNFL
jgi:hypothetical protein